MLTQTTNRNQTYDKVTGLVSKQTIDPTCKLFWRRCNGSHLFKQCGCGQAKTTANGAPGDRPGVCKQPGTQGGEYDRRISKGTTHQMHIAYRCLLMVLRNRF
jgi:hypothetical protein